MRWAMVSGMLMVRGEMWACTGFTGDSGASCFSLFSLDRAVNVILMFVLGNLNVHLKKEKPTVSTSQPDWTMGRPTCSRKQSPSVPDAPERHLVWRSHQEPHFQAHPMCYDSMNETTKRHLMTLKH